MHGANPAPIKLDVVLVVRKKNPLCRRRRDNENLCTERLLVTDDYGSFRFGDVPF